MKKEILMIKLNPKFQKEIFEKIIKKYGGRKSSLILRIPYSSLRGYKNLYFKSVPDSLINKIIDLKLITKKELKRKTLLSFNKNDQIKKCLNKGREKRNQNLQKIKESIPSVVDIISENHINVEKWFFGYKNLVNTGFRKIKIQEDKNFIIVNYSNYTRNGYKDFEIKIPKKIILDKDFYYFFGLWCGDRSGGKRFGIANKNEEIINFTAKFLKNNHQTVEKILVITEGVSDPKIVYDKKYSIKNSKKGWVISVHSNNGIFASFFYYLQRNLKKFLELSKNRESFFAGLFDAEGNVSLYNKSFRWACKNRDLINIYSKFLQELDLYDKYDGGCIVSYNLNQFYDKILPHLKHDKKIDLATFLCRGGGNLTEEYEEILKFIEKNPRKTVKEITKALKMNKVYSELKLLSDFNFISYNNYPYKYIITQKGIESLGDQNHNTS